MYEDLILPNKLPNNQTIFTTKHNISDKLNNNAISRHMIQQRKLHNGNILYKYTTPGNRSTIYCDDILEGAVFNYGDYTSTLSLLTFIIPSSVTAFVKPFSNRISVKNLVIMGTKYISGLKEFSECTNLETIVFYSDHAYKLCEPDIPQSINTLIKLDIFPDGKIKKELYQSDKLFF